MAVEIVIPGPPDIPRSAKVLAALAWGAAVAATPIVFRSLEPHPPHLVFQLLLGLLWGLPVALIVTALSFVHADARRRGMNAVGWTLLAALLIPGAIGFVLYFLCRKPVEVGCAGCGQLVRASAHYCSRCGHALHPTCPGCRQATRAGDGFCETCGSKLGESQAATPNAMARE